MFKRSGRKSNEIQNKLYIILPWKYYHAYHENIPMHTKDIPQKEEGLNVPISWPCYEFCEYPLPIFLKLIWKCRI